MEKLYCTIFVVDISQNPEEVETVTSRVQQLIEDYGGIIKNINRWGKRRLAYPIEKRTHGYYVEVEFTANSRLNIPLILEKEYRLNDRVLRYLTYVVDKKELMQREKVKARLGKEEEIEEPVSYDEEEEVLNETEEESTEVTESEKKETAVVDEGSTSEATDTPASEEAPENEQEKEGE